jgi:hypothetical protein
VSQRIDALICPRWTIAVEPDTEVHDDLVVAINYRLLFSYASL